MNKLGNKIMIIGEDRPLLYSLAFTLRRREYLVAFSTNPPEALKIILDAYKDGGQFSLIIIDIQMPGLAMLELIDSLRKWSMGIPMLVITSFLNADLSCRMEWLQIGNVITKPCTSEELIHRVNSILGLKVE